MSSQSKCAVKVAIHTTFSFKALSRVVCTGGPYIQAQIKCILTSWDKILLDFKKGSVPYIKVNFKTCSTVFQQKYCLVFKCIKS